MNGQELKEARLRKDWTQEEVADRLGVTQAYLSMLERGQRVVPAGLGRNVAELLNAPATTLPLREERVELRVPASERVRRELAGLGYPGFAHQRGGARRNPAEVLLHALNEDELESRASEGLPWLALKYSEMDWDWLVDGVKLGDGQNRLGIVGDIWGAVAGRAGGVG